jgi:hypothetical protein
MCALLDRAESDYYLRLRLETFDVMRLASELAVFGAAEAFASESACLIA